MKALKSISEKPSNSNTLFISEEYGISFPYLCHYVDYSTYVDLDKGVFYENGDTIPEGTKRVVDLVFSENLKEGNVVKQYSVNCSSIDINDIDLQYVLDKFHKNGFKNVSMKSLLSVYNGYKEGYNIGYKGDKYHLSTPIGNGPLVFIATKVSKRYKRSLISFKIKMNYV